MDRTPFSFSTRRRLGGSFASGVGRILVGIALCALLMPRPATATTTIREDGLLDVDGEVLFPIGLVELGTYLYEDWNDRIRRSGANLVWDIEIAYSDTAPSCGAVLDSATATGYYLLLGSGDTWNWDDINTPELEVDQLMYEEDEFAALLQCIDGSPQVIGFVNRDEPQWTISRRHVGDIDGPHVHWTFGQLHDATDGKVVCMNFAPSHVARDATTWKADVSSFLGATDIVMHHCYAYPPGEGTCNDWNVLGYPECKLDRLVYYEDTFLGELNLPGQPLWMIVQAHKLIPLKEARWQAYASVIHGATGLLWAGWTWWHELGSGRLTWPVIEQVIAEVSGLHSYLIGPDLPAAHTDHPDVEVRVKKNRLGKDAVGFAISREGYAGTAAIFLPKAGSGIVKVVNEDRTLVAVNGWIVDEFEEYEAHVYRYSTLKLSGGNTTAAPVVGPAATAFRLTASPNPSSGVTRAAFSLPRETAATFRVYDASGRFVATLGSGRYEAGDGEIFWDGRDRSGAKVAPGVYFFRGVTAAGEVASASVTIRR
jgi:hypothetical protein